MRVTRFNCTKVNSQSIGQPTARPQTDKTADAMLATRFQFFYFKIDARPPARQGKHVFNDISDLFDLTLNSPAIDEVIIVGWHALLTSFTTPLFPSSPPPASDRTQRAHRSENRSAQAAGT